MQPSEVMTNMQWVKGKLYQHDAKGHVVGCCLLGAIIITCQARSGFFEDDVYRCILRDVCDERYHGMSIPAVNDQLIATKEEAIEVLREVERRIASMTREEKEDACHRKNVWSQP